VLASHITVSEELVTVQSVIASEIPRTQAVFSINVLGILLHNVPPKYGCGIAEGGKLATQTLLAGRC